MLYPYRTVAEYTTAAPGRVHPPEEAGVLLVALVREIGMLFDNDPVVLHETGGSNLLLLYRDVAFRWQDLTEPYGVSLADVSRRWPLTLYGTTESREMAEVTVIRRDGALVTRLRSVSGKTFGALECLCLKVELELDGAEEAGHLAAVLRGMTRKNAAAALARVHEDFLKKWGLLLPTPGSLFCYLALEEELTPRDFLYGLTARQKETLWSLFLQEEVQPTEFEWLWSEYSAGSACHLLEWELTLRCALDELRFTVRNEAGTFEVTDASGRRRRFDLIEGGAGDRMFLKLLFPVELSK